MSGCRRTTVRQTWQVCETCQVIVPGQAGLTVLLPGEFVLRVPDLLTRLFP